VTLRSVVRWKASPAFGDRPSTVSEIIPRSPARSSGIADPQLTGTSATCDSKFFKFAPPRIDEELSVVDVKRSIQDTTDKPPSAHKHAGTSDRSCPKQHSYSITTLTGLIGAESNTWGHGCGRGAFVSRAPAFLFHRIEKQKWFEVLCIAISCRGRDWSGAVR
jgi:hypothetical protein